MFSNATAYALAAFVKAQNGLHHSARYASSAGVHDKETERRVREITDAVAPAGARKDPVKKVEKTSGGSGVVRSPPARRPPAETDEESERRVRATRAAAASLEAAKLAARKAAMAAKRKALVRGRCDHPKCGKFPYFAADASRTRAFCKEHKAPGMKEDVSKRCAHSNCDKRPSFGDADISRAEFCARHKDPGMECVKRKKICDSPSGATADGDASGSACSVSRDGGGGGVKRRRPASPSSRPSSKNRKPGKRSAQMQLFVNFKLELQNAGV